MDTILGLLLSAVLVTGPVISDHLEQHHQEQVRTIKPTNLRDLYIPFIDKSE